MNDVFPAVVDAAEEAVCNALFVADTVSGVGGNVVPGLPLDRVAPLLASHHSQLRVQAAPGRGRALTNGRRGRRRGGRRRRASARSAGR